MLNRQNDTVDDHEKINDHNYFQGQPKRTDSFSPQSTVFFDQCLCQTRTLAVEYIALQTERI